MFGQRFAQQRVNWSFIPHHAGSQSMCLYWYTRLSRRSSRPHGMSPILRLRALGLPTNPEDTQSLLSVLPRDPQINA